MNKSVSKRECDFFQDYLWAQKEIDVAAFGRTACLTSLYSNTSLLLHHMTVTNCYSSEVDAL